MSLPRLLDKGRATGAQMAADAELMRLFVAKEWAAFDERAKGYDIEPKAGRLLLMLYLIERAQAN